MAGEAQTQGDEELDSLPTEPFDDGFVPSTCLKPTRLLRQPAPRQLPPGMTVIADALVPELARETYEFTSALGEPWGTYFTLEGETSPGELSVNRVGAEPAVESLAERVLKSFWKRSAAALLRDDLKHVHGFGIWAVVGGVGFTTAYHLDYAEVYRRQTNVIRPPMHAATLQVSPLPPGSAVAGGTFGAHLDGLEHYRAHGYKTRRAQQQPREGQPTSDWGECDRWQYAPYRFNQATLCSGEYPHAADTVREWPPDLRRVVVGINTFGHVEGPSEAALPQHSKSFKRHVKLQQLEKMLVEMDPRARSKLIARAKDKVAARHGATDNRATAKERSSDVEEERQCA